MTTILKCLAPMVGGWECRPSEAALVAMIGMALFVVGVWAGRYWR